MSALDQSVYCGLEKVKEGLRTPGASPISSNTIFTSAPISHSRTKSKKLSLRTVRGPTIALHFSLGRDVTLEYLSPDADSSSRTKVLEDIERNMFSYRHNFREVNTKDGKSGVSSGLREIFDRDSRIKIAVHILSSNESELINFIHNIDRALNGLTKYNPRSRRMMTTTITENEEYNHLISFHGGCSYHFHEGFGCTLDSLFHAIEDYPTGTVLSDENKRVLMKLLSFAQSLKKYNLFHCRVLTTDRDMVGGRHEAFVALLNLNEMRKFIPNFEYIYSYTSGKYPTFMDSMIDLRSIYRDDDYRIPQTDYILTERVPRSSISLDEFLSSPNEKQNSEIIVVDSLLQVANALSFAWESIGFSHCNLLASNVFLVKEGADKEGILIPLRHTQRETSSEDNHKYLRTQWVSKIIDFRKSRVLMEDRRILFGRQSDWSPAKDFYTLILSCAKILRERSLMPFFYWEVLSVLFLMFQDDLSYYPTIETEIMKSRRMSDLIFPEGSERSIILTLDERLSLLDDERFPEIKGNMTPLNELRVCYMEADIQYEENGRIYTERMIIEKPLDQFCFHLSSIISGSIFSEEDSRKFEIVVSDRDNYRDDEFTSIILNK